MAVPGRAQPADRRRPGRPVTAGHGASGVRRGRPRRYRARPDFGSAAGYRRPPAVVARAPGGAGGNLLPRRYDRDRRPPARDPARHSQITAALRTAGAPPATARPRRDRGLMTSHPPRDVPGADAHGGTKGPAAGLGARPPPNAVQVRPPAALDPAPAGILPAAHPPAGAANRLVVIRPPRAHHDPCT